MYYPIILLALTLATAFMAATYPVSVLKILAVILGVFCFYKVGIKRTLLFLSPLLSLIALAILIAYYKNSCESYSHTLNLVYRIAPSALSGLLLIYQSTPTELYRSFHWLLSPLNEGLAQNISQIAMLTLKFIDLMLLELTTISYALTSRGLYPQKFPFTYLKILLQKFLQATHRVIETTYLAYEARNFRGKKIKRIKLSQGTIICTALILLTPLLPLISNLTKSLQKAF